MLPAPEGPRRAGRFAPAPGAPTGFDLTPAQAAQYGRLVARL